MNLHQCYQLLDLKPPVSLGELKSAYKDMVQVWHPDRFSHNPRLQEKAQEKLKEINTAYKMIEQSIKLGQTFQPYPESSRSSRSTEASGDRQAEPTYQPTGSRQDPTSPWERLNYRVKLQLTILAYTIAFLLGLILTMFAIYLLIAFPLISGIGIALVSLYFFLRYISRQQTRSSKRKP
ncbi:MAG: DnaJ domain-containing protein [Synechococcales bacterium]|nr:DnaJ domain-containing protein [Synechococcales bacterium]